MKKFTSVSDYIQSFEPNIIEKLFKIREVILNAVPEAKENVSYGIIGYQYKKKPLCYFGAFKEHIGFYGTPQSHIQYAKELTMYKQGKGSVQFPHQQKLPLTLISKMVKYKKRTIDHSENQIK